MAAPMPELKKVYLNDAMIGEASSWTEVHELLKAKRVVFAGKPSTAEGPTCFYVNGHFGATDQTASKKAGIA
jgi:hypothetical protein